MVALMAPIRISCAGFSFGIVGMSIGIFFDVITSHRLVQGERSDALGYGDCIFSAHSQYAPKAALSSRPQLSLKRTVLNRFGDIIAQNVFRTGEVSDGARDFQDAVV